MFGVLCIFKNKKVKIKFLKIFERFGIVWPEMTEFYYDLEFIVPSTPVLAHPLLKNIKQNYIKGSNAFENCSLKTNGNSTSKEDFVDPLSSAAAVSLPTPDVGVKKPQLTSIEELTGKILSNTLKAETKEPELDLDPELIGFRPWRDFKADILKLFSISDRLSLESSFLERQGSSPYLEKRR